MLKVADIFGASSEIQYHEQADSLSTQRRKIEHIRTLYYTDNLAAALPLGGLESKGINYESYQLAYTPLLLSHLFEGKIADLEAPADRRGFFYTFSACSQLGVGFVARCIPVVLKRIYQQQPRNLE